MPKLQDFLARPYTIYSGTALSAQYPPGYKGRALPLIRTRKRLLMPAIKILMVVKGYGVSDDINRAITLIHELGHVANFIYGDGSSRVMQNDVTPTGIVSQLNSLTVYRACFEVVP